MYIRIFNFQNMLHVTNFLSALYGDKGLQPRFSGLQIVIVLACFFWNQQIAAAFSDTKIGRNYFFIFFGKKERNMNWHLSFWKRKEERKEGKERRKGSICGLGLLFEQMGIAKVWFWAALLPYSVWRCIWRTFQTQSGHSVLNWPVYCTSMFIKYQCIIMY